MRRLRVQVNLRVVGESEQDRPASRVGQRVEHGGSSGADLAGAIVPSDREEVINPLSVLENAIA